MSPQAGAAGGAGGGLASLVPLILMFAIFYFLLILPQQKKTKEHREMVASLKKGDQIMTSSGFYGRIVDINDDILSLELGDRVRVRMNRSFVSQVVTGGDKKAAPPVKSKDNLKEKPNAAKSKKSN